MFKHNFKILFFFIMNIHYEIFHFYAFSHKFDTKTTCFYLDDISLIIQCLINYDSTDYKE